MPVALKTFDRLRDAVAALGSENTARYLGGGTLLVRNIHEGSVHASSMIRSTERGMTEIRPAGSRITIGAGVTMAEVAAHPDLQFLRPVANTIGGPPIRSMATVGGNLFAPYPYGDFAVAMIALEATVSVQSGYSPRDMAVEDFLTSSDRNNRAVVGAITFRRPDSPQAFKFAKFSRTHPKGASVLSIAAHLPASGGRLSNPRVAYGAMAPTAMRAKAVETALNGKSLDEAGIEPALKVATEGTKPRTDPFATEWYRREVLPVYLKRLLLS
jgi:CO/xanthine dehydrogenase FAD-binding subunit